MTREEAYTNSIRVAILCIKKLKQLDIHDITEAMWYRRLVQKKIELALIAIQCYISDYYPIKTVTQTHVHINPKL